MASAGLNFANLTPSNGAVRELRELVFLALADVESIGGQVNFLPSQKRGDKVGFVGEFGMLGVPASGCDPTYGNDLISTSEKTWDIGEWEIAEGICYADIQGTLAKAALKTKTSVDDLTGTEYMDEFLAPRLERAIKKLYNRVGWFGDKAASVYSSSNTSGTLKEGQNAKNFTIADGLWKRVFAGVTDGSIARVTVGANSQTTIAAQKTGIAADGVASGIVESMITSAPAVLRQQSGLRIYMTQALADALTLDYRHNNKGSDLQWSALTDGISTAQFAGVEIVAMPFWDEIIQVSLKNTTNANAWDKPFRAILSIKDNLIVGSESADEVAEISIHFDQKDRKNYIYAKDTIGTLIAQNNLVVAAY